MAVIQHNQTPIVIQNAGVSQLFRTRNFRYLVVFPLIIGPNWKFYFLFWIAKSDNKKYLDARMDVSLL